VTGAGSGGSGPGDSLQAQGVLVFLGLGSFRTAGFVKSRFRLC
jgi:hypothetical protein